MRLTTTVVFSALFLVGLVLAQGEDDSTTPKRVLKKYRVRRPVIVDEQGNVVRAGPRLRRVRVKKPETAALLQATPAPEQNVQTTTQSQQQGQREIIRVRRPQQQQPTANSIVEQPQQLVYDEESIVDAVRTVPTYRQATSPASREALLANVKLRQKGTGNGGEQENDKKIGTTRNYSRINEDGSFTFGYESEDGSFKEETRGTDCVVRGKYGYIDPEGVRREFEYVSGNPCDPNDPNKEEEQEEEEVDSLAPSKPILRQRVRPEISENNIQGFQQTLEQSLKEDELNNYVRPTPRQRISNRPTQSGTSGGSFPAFNQVRQQVRITTPPPPAYTPSTEEPTYIIRQRQASPSPSPSSRPIFYSEPSQSLDSSDRSNSGRAFNFDTELQRINSIHRPDNQPQPLYEQAFRHVQQQPSRQVFGNPTFHQQQQQQQYQATPSPPVSSSTASYPTPNQGNFGRFTSQLVFDPSTGKYTNNPSQYRNANQEFELSQTLRTFVQPTQESRTLAAPPSSDGSFTQTQQFGQPQIQYFGQPQQQQQLQQQRIQSPGPSQAPQDPSQFSQFLARHAYRVNQDQQQTQQPQHSVNNLQFIPPHLRPGSHQTADIERQEVREIEAPYAPRVQSANSASSSNGQIDAFLRALNISI